MRPNECRRREFLRTSGAAAAGIMLAGCSRREGYGEAGVTPAEDLMREHGVLRRVLLVYEEIVRRVNAGGDVPVDAFKNAAGLVRRFVEDYHEKLEEDHIFPRFEKAGSLAELAKLLRAQHDAGRKLTDRVAGFAAGGFAKKADCVGLTDALGAFIRMYRPHAAREDTVLFPALREAVKPADLAELGEAFEVKEAQLFGEGGFEKVVAQVATIERAFGLDDLSQFTPPATAL